MGKKLSTTHALVIIITIIRLPNWRCNISSSQQIYWMNIISGQLKSLSWKVFSDFLVNKQYAIFKLLFFKRASVLEHFQKNEGFMPRAFLPSIDVLLGRMVTAPSAISSCCWTGEIFDPQLSEPIQRKCPDWLAFLAASSIRLQRNNKRLI